MDDDGNAVDADRRACQRRCHGRDRRDSAGCGRTSGRGCNRARLYACGQRRCGGFRSIRGSAAMCWRPERCAHCAHVSSPSALPPPRRSISTLGWRLVKAAASSSRTGCMLVAPAICTMTGRGVATSLCSHEAVNASSAGQPRERELADERSVGADAKMDRQSHIGQRKSVRSHGYRRMNVNEMTATPRVRQ